MIRQVADPNRFPLNVTVWDHTNLLGKLSLPLTSLLNKPAEPGTVIVVVP